MLNLMISVVVARLASPEYRFEHAIPSSLDNLFLHLQLHLNQGARLQFDPMFQERPPL